MSVSRKQQETTNPQSFKAVAILLSDLTSLDIEWALWEFDNLSKQLFLVEAVNLLGKKKICLLGHSVSRPLLD